MGRKRAVALGRSQPPCALGTADSHSPLCPFGEPAGKKGTGIVRSPWLLSLLLIEQALLDQ